MTLLADVDAASELTFRMKRVRVVINGSPIEQALANGDFDAVVSSDDSSLAMAAGVAAVLRRGAGDDIRDEAARLQPVALGDVVVTAAGRLNTTFVFHAITRDLQRPIDPSDLTLLSIARSIFHRCEDLGIKRIAIPAVETGTPDLPAGRSARLILDALAEHASYPSSLLQVTFCLPEDQMRRALIADARELVTQDSHGGLNWRDASDDSPRIPAPGSVPLREPLRHGMSLRAPHVGAGESLPPTDTSVDGLLRSAGAPVFQGNLWSKDTLASPKRPATVDQPDAPAPLSEEPTRPASEPSAPGSHWLTSIFRRLIGHADEPDPHKSVQSNLLDLTGPPADPQSASHPRRMPSRGTQPLLHNRYVLLEELGRGGMGIVYLAWDLLLRHTVAVKTLLPGATVSPRQNETLRREAALQMNLAHQGIVRLFHFEPMSGAQGPYLVMEYVPWLTAARWIADAGSKGLPPGAVLHVGERLCEALTCAHDQGVLHLDIKPGNVFIDPAGEQPKLADFGIAMSLGPKRPDALVTRLIGTPGYMAPEQMTRGASVGPWTDVYLLAGTLWKLLTGHHATGEREERVDPVTAGALDVVRRGLAQSINERPATAAAFGALLAAASVSVSA